MTSREFTKALLTLGITQKALSVALDVNERTMRDYVGGRSRVPNPVAALLHLMIDHRLTLEEIRL